MGCRRVVLAATDMVVVLRQGQLRLLLHGNLVEAVLENGLDRLIGAAADLEGAATGGFEPGGRVGLTQPQQPQTGAIGLLGVRLAFQDVAGQLAGVRTGLLGPSDDARGRPLQVLLVGLGTMGRIGGARGTAPW